MSETFRPGAARALFMSTMAFGVAFAIWGLISALAPTFTELYNLSATSKSILIAVPVLLGSIGRLPAGMLTDRYGGRIVFSVLLIGSAIPAVLIGFTSSYNQLLLLGLLIGLAGTSFAIGVAFTSKWFPPEKQGMALGVYGVGNIGQSVAVFAAPVLVLWLTDWRPVFYIFAAITLVWGIIFYIFAKDAETSAKPKTFAENLNVLRNSPKAWVLSIFYFLTFGGFVAFSIYLPTLLKDVYDLSPTDAGARTAGFVILATLLRPVGGILADKFGGAKILTFVFASIAGFSVLLVLPSMIPFSIGALCGAAALGMGSGAVFKLVPQYFPKETGTVTGLVGAFGGLGGFFPPLVLGVVRDLTESYAIGFIFLTLFSIMCLVINYLVFIRGSKDKIA